MTDFSAKERKKYATVHVNGKDKFPIKSRESAENAEHLINNAKPPLSSGQKAAVRRREAAFGVHPATGKAKAKKGKGK